MTGSAVQAVDLASLELAAYEWSEEFSNGQPIAYRAQNKSYVTTRLQLSGQRAANTNPRQACSTATELIKIFLSVFGDNDMPHGPATYHTLELENFCAQHSLDILEQGVNPCVTKKLVLLDDRCRLSHNPIRVNPAGERRTKAGILGASQLLVELRKQVCHRNLVFFEILTAF